MFVNRILIASNPFIDAYIHSDYLGKLIFIGLIILSILTWILLIHKVWITYLVRRNSLQFKTSIRTQNSFVWNLESKQGAPNPFFELYGVLKKYTLDLLNKNSQYGDREAREKKISYLSPSDLNFLEGHISTKIAEETKNLEKHVFILSTIVSLAPFLGLLGTVWGILTTFSELQVHALGSTQQSAIGGLSLALATTVMGLLDAIPALIGYNYLKNVIRDYQTEMESFSNEMLSCVEMQYRKVDFS